MLYTFNPKSRRRAQCLFYKIIVLPGVTPSFKDAPGQVEVVAAGKSWAASPHLYAYQPAHFHFQEEQLDLGVEKKT